MIDIHGNKLPKITDGNRITIKSDERKYNLVPMCYSQKYNVWFNYNCVCEDTQHRVILWMRPTAFDLPVTNGIVVFFSVQYNKDKLDYINDDVASYNVTDAQVLIKEKPISAGTRAESISFVKNYIKRGFKRIMFEKVYLHSINSKINQEFLIIYSVDKDDVQIGSEPVTYYYDFDDDELINKEVSTQELFLLGQKEMLSVLPYRNTVDFSASLEKPIRDCYLQFKDGGIYQDYKMINDGSAIVLFMHWSDVDKMFITEEVWLDTIEDSITICYIPEEDSVDLLSNRLVTGIIIATLEKRVRTLKSGEKYALLSQSDLEEYANVTYYRSGIDVK